MSEVVESPPVYPEDLDTSKESRKSKGLGGEDRRRERSRSPIARDASVEERNSEKDVTRSPDPKRSKSEVEPEIRHVDESKQGDQKEVKEVNTISEPVVDKKKQELEKWNELFKDRYTDKDPDFIRLQSVKISPPIVYPWDDRDFRNSNRGWNRQPRREHERPNRNDDRRWERSRSPHSRNEAGGGSGGGQQRQY